MRPYRWGQIISLILLNLYIFGFFQKELIYTGPLKAFLAPILHCWSAPTALFSCPLGAFQHFITIHLLPLYPLGFLILISAFIGRMPCGWVCPFGFLQDLLYKIKIWKWRLPDFINIPGIILGIVIGYIFARGGFELGIYTGLPLAIFFGLTFNLIPKIKKVRMPMNYLKYLFLLIFAILFAYFRAEPWFCKICPAGTLEAGIPLVLWDPENYLKSMVGFFFYFKIFILGFLLINFIAIKRPFCRAVCPIGAIYSLTNRLSLFHLGNEKEICTGCGVCEKVCPTAIPWSKIPENTECIRCLECYLRCPKRAIKVKWG
uniref:4Fe-4S binding protein n=1 Tax=candidate division WOR-3 bacterium TaxID=2052148 RepID=A0A7C3UXC3_UNCW3